MEKKEREVLVVAFLAACVPRPPPPHPVDSVLQARWVLCDIMRRMSCHVAQRGVRPESAAPIPLTLVCSIPVSMWFRRQVQDVQAAVDLDHRLTLEFSLAVKEAPGYWERPSTQLQQKLDQSPSDAALHRAAHAICRAAHWTASIMPHSYTTGLRGKPEAFDLCGEQESNRAVEVLDRWQVGASDAQVEYQIVIECNLAWVFPSPGEKVPARAAGQFDWDSFTVQSRTLSERFPLSVNDLSNILKAGPNRLLDDVLGASPQQGKPPGAGKAQPLADATNKKGARWWRHPFGKSKDRAE